jgi:hypothetical protein
MEFFATTGEYKNETGCQTWQARGSGRLYRKVANCPKFLNLRKYAMISIRIFLITTTTTIDDSFDGLITVSPKGVHFVPTLYGYATEGLDISTPCNSVIHMVIISEEVCTC